MRRLGLILILTLPLPACSETEFCIFGDKRQNLDEGISVEITDYGDEKGIYLRLPDVVNSGNFKWASISFFNEDGKRTYLDLNANRVRRGVVKAAFTTSWEFVHFSVSAHYGSSCTGTVIDQAWELEPNKGFNRTPESSGPAKPGESGGGAG